MHNWIFLRKNFSYDPPVDLDDETIKGSISDVESIIGVREFDKSYFMEDSDPEKMYDDIVHPPSIDSQSLTSNDIITSSGAFSRECAPHYYDETGNSTRTSQYDSGNPVIDYSSSGCSVAGVGSSSNTRTP